eukprot:768253-Hanusia_phi.AAC.1
MMQQRKRDLNLDRAGEGRTRPGKPISEMVSPAQDKILDRNALGSRKIRKQIEIATEKMVMRTREYVQKISNDFSTTVFPVGSNLQVRNCSDQGDVACAACKRRKLRREELLECRNTICVGSKESLKRMVLHNQLLTLRMPLILVGADRICAVVV